jgi:hypothetical protein
MRFVYRRPEIGYPTDPNWLACRVTELLLMGHSWKSVRNILLISKSEFDCILDCAIDKARTEQKQVETRDAKKKATLPAQKAMDSFH